MSLGATSRKEIKQRKSKSVELNELDVNPRILSQLRNGATSRKEIKQRKSKSVELNELDVNPRILSQLRNANLSTFATILSLSSPDIERLTKLTANEARGVKTVVAETVTAKSHACQGHTALDLYKQSCTKGCNSVRLTTGCPILDKFFKGGIISRGITELCGLSASGKTQLCLQLCLSVQLPIDMGGLGAGAVYICTEDVFPNKRLYQMIASFTQTYKHKTPSPISFGDNIFIEHIPDVESLQTCIHHRLPSLLSKGGIRLIVIDSVAALFRCEYATTELYTRSQHLTSFAAQLIRLGEQHNMPLICVNQVTASMTKGKSENVPALGLTWANQVTTRVLFTRRDQYTRRNQGNGTTASGNHGDVSGYNHGNNDGNNCNSNHSDNHHKTGSSNHGNDNEMFEQHVVRTMEIVYAPHLPTWVCQFEIDQNGIHGVL